jgi:biotin carboxylase
MVATEKGKVLVLGASVWQLPIIEQIHALGYPIVATDMNPDSIGFGVAEYSAPVDITDKEGTLRVAREHDVIAAVSDQTDLAMAALSYVCENMNLPGPSRSTALNTTNKRVMRELTENHLPTPKWFATDDRAECIARTKEIGLPVVIKPTDSQASRGVRKVDRESDIGPAFDNALPFSLEGKVLVEEFMIGREATLEGFHDSREAHLLGVSLKRHTPPPCIIATNLDFPAPLPDRHMERVEWTFRRLTELLGITGGPIHGEVILTRDGPMLVEMANRGGGSGTVSHLIPAISGVNVLEAYVRQAVGEQVTIRRTRNRGGVMRFKIWPDGKIAAIEGLEEARAMPGVVFIILYIKPGETLCPIVMDTQRHGLIITEGEDLAAAREVMTEVEKKIQIIYE